MNLFDLLFCKKKHTPKISLLIPFSSNNQERKKVFKWVKEYWKHELPHAEIIIGKDKKYWWQTNKVFCKNAALNNAVKKSKGKVLVIMDADAYIRGGIINKCADRILEEIDNHLWYVPYHHLYRLNESVTQEIIESDPSWPLRIPSPPLEEWLQKTGHNSRYGHRYGAMCMMFPREAYNVLGCFDERFIGWGSEDISLLRALDTLWGKHKVSYNDMLHLYHPFIGTDYKSRQWEGQDRSSINSNLGMAYHRANRNPSKMRELINKAIEFKNNKNK